MAELSIRLAKDSDADGLVALIEGCFNEYEGCVLDPEGIDKPLYAIRSWVEAEGGEFWVAEDGSRIVGSVGWVRDASGMELVKLYVNKKCRRRGLATRLLRLVEQAAEERGLEINFWSDTRFLEAHKFYTVHGYEKLTETRELNDPSRTTEYHFRRAVERIA